jgi:hypothetical protein
MKKYKRFLLFNFATDFIFGAVFFLLVQYAGITAYLFYVVNLDATDMQTTLKHAFDVDAFRFQLIFNVIVIGIAWAFVKYMVAPDEDDLLESVDAALLRYHNKLAGFSDAEKEEIIVIARKEYQQRCLKDPARRTWKRYLSKIADLTFWSLVADVVVCMPFFVVYVNNKFTEWQFVFASGIMIFFISMGLHVLAGDEPAMKYYWNVNKSQEHPLVP